MNNEINAYLLKKINERKENNAFRTLKIGESSLVDFCSNDYLGFANDKLIAQEVHKELMALSQRVNGSTGARTITGTDQLTLDLEKLIANFHKAEAALLYNSGYTANLGFFAALPYRGDTILYDELIHASIRDGMQLSKANAYSFKHNDIESLRKKLTIAKGKIYVVVESVYSMDGDQSPLNEIANICQEFDAALIVDEAHSNGLFGEKGEGLVSHFNLEEKVFARIMTYGKAFGCHGAAIVGNQLLKDFLINYSRPFIFTTAPSIHQVLTIKKVYDKLSNDDYKIKNINNLIKLFKSTLKDNTSLKLIESFSPIQCIIIPGNDSVKAFANFVQQAGFDVRPIVAPTVPIGKERIRICIHSFNTEEEILALVNQLKLAANEI